MNIHRLLVPCGVLKSAVVMFLALLGCGGDVGNVHVSDLRDGHNENPNEVITTTKLTWIPTDGTDPIVVTWSDPELDGQPQAEHLRLTLGQSYVLHVEIFNELEEPIEDLTPEFLDELEEHQVFFTGGAVVGPCNTHNTDAILEHAYEDADGFGHPVGERNVVRAFAAGTGTMNVLLRHMPSLNGTHIKTGDLADTMNRFGASALPGSTDFNIEIHVEVE